jgi:hypothetical protein
VNVEVAQSSEQPQHVQLRSSSQSSVHNLVIHVASKVAQNLDRSRKEKDPLDARVARETHAA